MRAEKYYYIRDNIKTDPDGNGRLVVTVCVIKDEIGDMARGIAICSDQDQPCKKVGRSIAKTRAYHALYMARNSCEMRRADKVPLIAFVDGFYKSTYNPDLTEYESMLLGYQPSEDAIDEAKEILRTMKENRIGV